LPDSSKPPLAERANQQSAISNRQSAIGNQQSAIQSTIGIEKI
jgi:hypothetical protein